MSGLVITFKQFICSTMSKCSSNIEGMFVLCTCSTMSKCSSRIEGMLIFRLNSSDTDELNIIQHSPYMSDEELIQSRILVMNRLNILSLNCQSLHAKFDYIKLLTEKFMSKNCPLQVICLQETWFASNTDLSLYEMPGYHIVTLLN